MEATEEQRLPYSRHTRKEHEACVLQVVDFIKAHYDVTKGTKASDCTDIDNLRCVVRYLVDEADDRNVFYDAFKRLQVPIKIRRSDVYACLKLKKEFAFPDSECNC